VPLLLVVLFIVVPIAELALLIQVGQLIGVWWTILLLIADAVIGSWLLRTQSRAAWRRFNEALAQGRVPHREVVDGVLVIFGGVLLLTPGFITDIFGVLFLFPPTRVLLRGLLVRRGARREAAKSRAGRSRPRSSCCRDGYSVDCCRPLPWPPAGPAGAWSRAPAGAGRPAVEKCSPATASKPRDSSRYLEDEARPCVRCS
jgi:UPF0716 protein FxsA